jgi:hypothetical protein
MLLDLDNHFKIFKYLIKGSYIIKLKLISFSCEINNVLLTMLLKFVMTIKIEN